MQSCPPAEIATHPAHEIDVPIVHGYAALVMNETDVVSSVYRRMQAIFCLTEDPLLV